MWQGAWRDSSATARRAVAEEGRHPIPVYGNAGNLFSLPMGIVISPYMDVYFQEVEIWNRVGDQLAPNQTRGSIPRHCSPLAKKVAEGAMRGTGKPSWSCLGDVCPLNMTTRLYLSEETANNVSPWSLLGFMDSALPPSQVRHDSWAKHAYYEHLRHTQFVNRQRSLVIDRTRVADIALVYCLACSFWREFSDMAVPQEHLSFLTAVARLLEHQGIAYEVVVLGFDGLFANLKGLDGLRMPLKYQSVILPAVDAIADTDATLLQQYVRAGGTLILNPSTASGDVPVIGSHTERLQRRGTPAFHSLLRDPGRGKLVTLRSDVFASYISTGNTTAEDILSQQLRPIDPTIVYHRLPPNVWSNVYHHGNGPMLSIHFVNYNIDVAFKATVSIGRTANLSSFVAHAFNPSGLDQRLQVSALASAGKLVVEVPAVHDYMVIVVASSEGEMRVRQLAAVARKALEQLVVANTSLGLAEVSSQPGYRVTTAGPTSAHGARNAIMTEADKLLGQIQGSASEPLTETALIGERLERLTVRLVSALKNVTASVAHNTKGAATAISSMCTNSAAKCVKAFSFGAGPVHGQWKLVTESASYSDKTGFGFTTPRSHIHLLNNSGRPDWLHGSGLWSDRTSRFRIDGLSVGAYVVTVVCGGHDLGAIGRSQAGGAWGGGGEFNSQWMIYASTAVATVATTAGRSHTEPVLLGARGSNPGTFTTRAFRVSIVTPGQPLELELSGGAQGIAFGSNKFSWLLTAVIVQPADAVGQAPPSVQQALSKWDSDYRTTIRDFEWCGPFDASDGRGVETVYPPEAEFLANGTIDRNRTYAGLDGREVMWRTWRAANSAGAPFLPLSQLAGPRPRPDIGRVAFVAMRVCAASRAASRHTIRVSMTGEGKVWAAAAAAAGEGRPLTNSPAQLIIEDELITGLYANESYVDIEVAASDGSLCTQLLVKSVDTFGGVYNTFTLDPEYQVTEGRAAIGDHLWGVWAATAETTENGHGN
eukprot:COSAG05_NODE_2142_length_3486_cov_1.351048_1_plen_991_part_00